MTRLLLVLLAGCAGCATTPTKADPYRTVVQRLMTADACDAGVAITEEECAWARGYREALRDCETICQEAHR